MDTVNIQCRSGTIIGRVRDETILFAGIPYAEPPVGELRFKPPQPLRSSLDNFEAFKFGAAAPQVSGGGMTDSAKVRWSEDCLTLNISAPAAVRDEEDTGKRAVLVWIHGGGYRTGQGAIPWYNGTSFAKNHDIIVVSMNYRLGALGFADLTHLGEEFATSNVNGMLDQIAALEWVRDNIADFGGDPNRVTIAGESAGGFSVGALMGCPSAKGLFCRAIPQSGAASHTLSPYAAATVGAHFQKELGARSSIEVMTADVESILNAQTKTAAYFEGFGDEQKSLGTTVSPFYPTHGTTLLPESPLTAIRGGLSKGIALLTGSNGDETTLWGYGKVDQDRLDTIIQMYQAGPVLDALNKELPGASLEDLAIAVTTDHMFRIPCVRLAEAQSKLGEATWMYLFTWKSRAFEGKLGATHALEIPFAFNNLKQPGVDAFIGPGDLPQHLADVMHNHWALFIKEGNPGWEQYSESSRKTMVFDDESRVIEDPNGIVRQAWTDIR